MRKPTIHYTFNLENIRGLTNVLTKKDTFSNCIQETDVELLHVVTTGPIPPNPAELLSSQTMDNLLDAACKEYDMVLIDTPPLLAVTDAQVLANKCDGTILVIKSGETQVEAAIKAKELLVSANAKIIGTVLNEKNYKRANIIITMVKVSKE